VWLGLLFSTIGIAASDFFCINLSTIAAILGMSESMAGVTFLAFGNGSPDVFSTFAAMSTNSSSLAIGELFGAAGFITAVVAGSMALVRPFKVAKKSFIRDVGFFVVAAGFSMGFLSDGRLRLWECILMVVYYVFYVAVVIAWHWWVTRRVRRKQKELAARGHFEVPGTAGVADQEEYHDEDEEEVGSRPTISRGVSAEDFQTLENGGIPQGFEPEDEEDEEAMERWMGELSSNMRLSRPMGGRRNTITPIRPSLVGALEFQAVLKSLQQSRNIQTIPMHSRRYSDDPTYTSAQQQDNMSEDDPASRPPFEVHDDPRSAGPLLQRPGLDVRGAGRARAVSAGDMGRREPDSNLLKSSARPSQDLIDIAEDDNDSGSTKSMPHASAAPTTQRRFPDSRPLLSTDKSDYFQQHKSTAGARHKTSPQQSPLSRPQQSLRIQSRGQSYRRSPLSLATASPFPAYHDDPSAHSDAPPNLQLPPASMSVDSPPPTDEDEDLMPDKPPNWWPARILPPPKLMIATLFPTLFHWRTKSWWERILAIIAAPTVFLLTLTLPVVEADIVEEDDTAVYGQDSSDQTYEDNRRKSVAALAAESPALLARDPEYERRTPSLPQVTSSPGTGSGAVAAASEQALGGDTASGSTKLQTSANNHPESAPSHPHRPPSPPKVWNRWLTIMQLFLAPLMIVFVIFTQYMPPEGNFGRAIIEPVLIALLTSLVLLVPLLLTTTANHRPKAYQTILSLAGFVMSIAWISTIASQVVAVLKFFAVVLNMSQAILGLTIFAVGNSLGDLVADVTVARLGYPVMALSACFGGPMLNILLGIGLSGCWILIQGAEKRQAKHPHKGLHFKTYEIEVGDTLIVSGITLLVTLLGLLVAVPLNNWMMSRRIAWVLIALWCVGTIINVVLEIWQVGKAHAVVS